MKYIKDEHEGFGNCVFCEKLKENNDKDNLILFRAKKSFVVMNLYPYNNGHLMVIPNKHTSDMSDITNDEAAEIHMLQNKSMSVISKVMDPHGFNIGLNVGQEAGAGIAEHLHWHIVPRWKADTNFMPVINDIRVIPQALEDTYALLKKAFDD